MELFKNFESAELDGQQIRVTPRCPKRVSVIDTIGVITGNKCPKKTWSELQKNYPEVVQNLHHYKFPGKGQRETPVVGARGLVTIMNLLQGERAAMFRAAEAEVLVRYLGGDMSLIREIEDIREAQQQLPADHPARIFGEHVERLGGLSGTKEALGEILDASEKIAAFQPRLTATTRMLREFPFTDYGTILDMRGRECDLDDRQLATRREAFQLTQQENEHGLRVRREAATLDDRPAKRLRYGTETTEGVTVTDILAELAKSVRNPRAFLRQAEESKVRLRAYNVFGDYLVPGARAPRRYKGEAAQEIGETIREWVAAAQPAADAGIKRFFVAEQQPAAAAGPVIEPDLYD